MRKVMGIALMVAACAGLGGVVRGDGAGTRPGAVGGVVDDIVSVGAAERVDEADLIRKLTGDDALDEGGVADKKLAGIIERMETSESMLKKTDAGEVTQEIQRRIVLDLDVLIEKARKNDRGTGASGGTTPARESRLRKDGTTLPGEKEKEKEQDKDKDKDKGERERGIHVVNQDGWVKLPARDRGAILNGMREEVLPGYQKMMERYYEELARGK